MSETISFEAALDILKRAKNILITSHIHPDGDAIGSSLAMRHALMSLDKNVRVCIKDNVPECYAILKGCDQISKKIRADYIPDLIVLLDSRKNRVGGVCDKFNVPILNIDHHVSNDRKADWLILEPDASSTCEIIYKFFVERGLPIDADVAMCLYTGIATDTGFFRFDNTTYAAMSIGAELVRLGAKPSVIADSIATKDFHELKQIARALRTVELFADGKVIGVFLDRSMSDLVLTDDLIDMIRFAKGADIAFLLKYESRNRYRVRMRSRQTDISGITAALGGGGHKHAAGAALRGTMEEVKAELLNAIARVL